MARAQSITSFRHIRECIKQLVSLYADVAAQLAGDSGPMARGDRCGGR